MIGALFRRGGGISKTEIREHSNQDLIISRRKEIGENEDNSPNRTFAPNILALFLCKGIESLRIWDTQVDSELCFTEQINGLLNRDNARRGITAKAARVVWGLEAGVLSLTHSAPDQPGQVRGRLLHIWRL